MNLFNDLQRLKSEVEALKVRLNSIMVGQTIITTQFTGLLPLGNGGTGSPYGPLFTVPVWVNNSGGNLVDGDVVALDFSGARRVDSDTVAANLDVVGVVKGAGPFANGASTPVMVLGYHTSVKVQGTVAAGDYLATSATVGRAESVGTEPVAGAFARAFTANPSGAGTVEAYVYPVVAGAGGSGGGPVISDQTANTDGVETTFTLPSTPAAGTVRVWLNGLMQREGVDFTVSGDDVVMDQAPAAADELIIVYGNEGDVPFTFLQLLDTPDSFVGKAGTLPMVNDGETALEFVETTGARDSYDPDLQPTTPHANDDELADPLLPGWTQVGSPDTFNGTDLPGFLHIVDNDGVEPCGGYKSFTPGANAFTFAFKVHGNVANAASNQVYAGLYTSAGAAIVSAGLLNGNFWIVNAAALGGGFSSGSINDISANVTQLYVVIQRDATTNYTVKISRDGKLWVQVAAFSQAGTVDRYYATVAGFSSTNAEAYYDFFRIFTTQTVLIGNTPRGAAVALLRPPGDPDIKPTSPNAMDDEFDDTAGNSGATNGLLSKWAWRNQSTSTVTFPRASWLTLTIPAQSATNALRGIEQVLPAGDGAWAAKLSLELDATDFAMGGLWLADNTNGDLYTIMLGTRTVAGNVRTFLQIARWNSVTSYNSDALTFELGPATTGIYLRIERATTTLVVKYSSDGNGWIRMGSFADAVGVDRIGIFANETNNSGRTKVHCDWFRRVA